MGDIFNNLSGNLKRFHSGLSPVKKATLYLLGSLIVISLLAMSFWAGESSYQVLFRQLTPQDSVGVTKWLQEAKIPYLISEGGGTVSVPPEFTNMARLKIMGADVIRADVVGYEIFNRDHFGMTSFVQKLNYKRAQEGELVRTIQSLSNVSRARVSITTPPERAFSRDQEDPKASVFLELESGARLTKADVQAIANLVGSAVEGLRPERVAIIDSRGRMLNSPKGEDWSAQSQSVLEYKDGLERNLESHVSAILEKVVGVGSVEVRINADIDFKKSSSRRRDVDANNVAVLSQQNKEDSLQGKRPNPTGVPGARTEIPGQPQQGVPTVSQDVTKNLVTVNNVVPETVTQEEKLPGSVQRLTVAVLLDPTSLQKIQSTTDAEKKEGAPAVEEVKVDDAFKKKIEGLVGSAVGLNKERGDQIHIEVMPFARPDIEDGDRHLRLMERREVISNVVKFGVPALFLFFFFLWVIRPFIKWVTTSTGESVEKQLPKTVEELEAVTTTIGTLGGMESLPLLEEQVDPDKAEGELLKEKIISMVEAAPSKAAQIIQEWLAADLSKKKDR